MKKLIFIPIIFVFLSCNSIKIKEMEMDSTQELIGKVKQIEMNTFRYPIRKNDTIVRKENSVVFFDKKNRIIKQIDYYLKFIDETDFNYKNNLLENTISKSGKRIRKTEYKYDDKNNIIEYNQLENDTLYFRKNSIYDSKNNPLEQTYFHPNYKRNNSVEKFTYDYKNRIVKIQSFDENNKPKNHYLKTYFNKKGYIIKTEFIYTDSNIDYSNKSIIEYDKLGNLTKRTSFDKDGKPKESTESRNIYDEKGNIIVREKYMNEKLIEKTTYKITYR
jgi:hypothetical protein